ncbi:unnamed protein product [Phaeothamnion confervicola]
MAAVASWRWRDGAAIVVSGSQSIYKSKWCDLQMQKSANLQKPPRGMPRQIFKISGGNDKQGFPMKQGVLVNHRVRLLLTKGLSCYRQRRKGERKRKSVRGCIVGSDLAVLNLTVEKKGEQDVPGLTDVTVPRRLGPKRASNIRKLFNLSKDDDVTKYVISRKFEKKGKTVSKSPKIQRLVTPVTLQRKRRRIALKKQAQEKAKLEAAEYTRLVGRSILLPFLEQELSGLHLSFGFSCLWDSAVFEVRCGSQYQRPFCLSRRCISLRVSG